MAEYQINIETSTAALQSKYLAELQRLVDILRFSLAGAESVNEAGYNDFIRFWGITPAADHCLTYHEVAQAAEQWHLKHCFQDAIEVIGSFLEEVYLF